MMGTREVVMPDESRFARADKSAKIFIGVVGENCMIFVRAYLVLVRTRATIMGNVVKDRPSFCVVIATMLLGGYVAASWKLLFPAGAYLSELFLRIESDLTHRESLRFVCVLDLFLLMFLTPGFVSSFRKTTASDATVQLVYVHLRKEWVIVGLGYIDVLTSWLALQLVLAPVLWLPFVSHMSLGESCQRSLVCLLIALTGILMAAAWISGSLFLEARKRPLIALWITGTCGYALAFFVGWEVRKLFAGSSPGSLMHQAIVYMLDMMQTEQTVFLWTSLVTLITLIGWTGLWIGDGIRERGSLE